MSEEVHLCFLVPTFTDYKNKPVMWISILRSGYSVAETRTIPILQFL